MWRLFVGFAEALKQCRAHDGQSDRGVDEDLAEAAAFIGWHELAPGDGFRIGRAGKTSPKNGLRTDAHAVVIALERYVFSRAADSQLAVWAELLRPVPGNAAANGENPDLLLCEHGIGEMIQVEEG